MSDQGAWPGQVIYRGMYGKCELMVKACKRRGIKASQRLDKVYVVVEDLDREQSKEVDRLAERYELHTFASQSALFGWGR